MVLQLSNCLKLEEVWQREGGRGGGGLEGLVDKLTS